MILQFVQISLTNVLHAKLILIVLWLQTSTVKQDQVFFFISQNLKSLFISKGCKQCLNNTFINIFFKKKKKKI